jgi:hypothetical protein
MNFRFVHAFRESCFRTEQTVSRDQRRVLNPPRTVLVANIKSTAPGYVFPKCFVIDQDLQAELRARKEKSDVDSVSVKFQWRRYQAESGMSDEEERMAPGSDEEEGPDEDANDDELIGEYNVAQYEDQETGDDDQDDDDSEDNY